MTNRQIQKICGDCDHLKVLNSGVNSCNILGDRYIFLIKYHYLFSGTLKVFEKCIHADKFKLIKKLENL